MKPIEKSTHHVDPLSIQRDMTLWVAIDLPDRVPVKIGEAVERSRERMAREIIAEEVARLRSAQKQTGTN
jgi:hypothetical protein